ncbi:hypothetical protein ACHAWF_011755 [Thalassiosira exigua]
MLSALITMVSKRHGKNHESVRWRRGPRIHLLIFLGWLSQLSFVGVNARLQLWLSSNKSDENSSKSDSKDVGDKEERSGSSIRERLRLYQKHDDGATRRYDPISPSEYLDVVLRYLRSGLDEMIEHIHTTSGRSGRARHRDMLSEPKDAWEGFLSAFAALRTGYAGGVRSLVDGAYELGYGTIAACAAVVRGSPDALSYAFWSELVRGLGRGADRASDGLYLFAAGAVVGTRNLLVGIYRTPEAVRASQLGMMYFPRSSVQQWDNGGGHKDSAGWDYYSLDSEDDEIRKEEERLQMQDLNSQSTEKKKGVTKQNIRRRHGVSVRDSKYYDILGVKTSANSKEIRSAYRKEALKRHPDKQNAPFHATSVPLQDEPHIEGFLDLTEAYRILSNDASRDAYDRHGLCFREEATVSGVDGEADYFDLINELFGTDAVQDYVGNIQIAPIVNEMLGSTDHHSSIETLEMQKLQQRRRTVDSAKYLRAFVNKYVLGELTLDEYIISCQIEVCGILRGGGESLLGVIGNTLSREANQQTGFVVPFVRKSFSDSSQKVKSSIANAKVYLPIYFRLALEGLLLGNFSGKKGEGSDDCSGSHKPSKEFVDQDAVLDLLWQYVVNDTVVTLREACAKIFADRGTRDAGYAFLQTPAWIKHQRAKRAEAVRILAREMLAVSADV